MAKFLLNHPDNAFFHKMEKFKERKWGMKNFFKISKQERSQFKEELEYLYKASCQYCQNPHELQELTQTLMDLKQALESIHKNQVSDSMRFKLNLHSFEEQLNHFAQNPKQKKK